MLVSLAHFAFVFGVSEVILFLYFTRSPSQSFHLPSSFDDCLSPSFISSLRPRLQVSRSLSTALFISQSRVSTRPLHSSISLSPVFPSHCPPSPTLHLWRIDLSVKLPLFLLVSQCPSLHLTVFPTEPRLPLSLSLSLSLSFSFHLFLSNIASSN